MPSALQGHRCSVASPHAVTRSKCRWGDSFLHASPGGDGSQGPTVLLSLPSNPPVFPWSARTTQVPLRGPSLEKFQNLDL